MDLAGLRRLIVTAVAADDVLVEKLVLKGGNALELVHRIGQRASLDLDYSMDGDFDDADQVGARLQHSLQERFDAAGHVVFDYTFGPRPPTADQPPGTWGGYRAEFKIISRERHRELAGNLESMQRRAVPMGPDQKRIFKVDISKYEYCDGRQEAKVDEFTFLVYTPAMIAAEKLRAICQQMPEYRQRRHPAPRPRDFYDIHAVITAKSVDVTSLTFREMVGHMFVAKNVPLALLGFIGREREFHRQGWPSVKNAVVGELREFDFYFDFVAAEVERLQAVGMP